MPKSNLVRDPTRERAELFSANLDKYMRVRNKTASDLARCIGLEAVSVYQKKQHPEKFSFMEILRLMDYLKFSVADRAEVVGIEIKICELGG